jgi:hypothetical protein
MANRQDVIVERLRQLTARFGHYVDAHCTRTDATYAMGSTRPRQIAGPTAM